MTKASTPEGLLALCPNELAGNKKVPFAITQMTL
jgi:hypothetical protein